MFAADEVQATALIAGGDSVLDGLYDVAIALAAETATRREQVQMRWQLMERYPALLPRMFARLEEFEKVLASAVAARTGDAPGDAYPQLMAAIAMTGMRTAVQRWTAGHGDHPLEHHMNEVFGLLREGLAGPAGPAEPSGPAGPRQASGEPRVRSAR